jgi:hypothetical protein
MATAAVTPNELKRLVAEEVQRQSGQAAQTLDEQRERSRQAQTQRVEEMRLKLEEAKATEKAMCEASRTAEAELAAVRTRHKSELQGPYASAVAASGKRGMAIERTRSALLEWERAKRELHELGGLSG